jgi:ectoine hydroxylase-related dioxygenase (phytanoyl-CoA dioxygenase family)
MMAAVTPADIATYERDGVVRIAGAFSRQWVDDLTAAFDRVLARAEDPDYDRRAVGRPGMRKLEVTRGKFGDLSVQGLIAHDPVFLSWISDSPAAQLCAEITRSKTMRFWTDATFQKDTSGESNGTPWHNDYCTWPFWGEQLPILWLALTDVGMEDAPLQTLIGSHAEPHRYYSWLSPPGLGTNEMYHPWQELLDKVAAPGAPIKAWTMRAGDCLLIHSKTIHNSLPRTTSRPGRRLALSTRWLGDDAIWAPDAYTPMGEYLSGEVDMVHGQAPSTRVFPIQWRSTSLSAA